MLWLGETRGYLTDWITQQWVCASGRPIDLEHDTWLTGPVGSVAKIGTDYFADLAHESGLKLLKPADAGLIQDFCDLAWEEFDPNQVHPAVRHFYERTSAYNLDSWAQWSAVFRPFGGLIATIFSRRLQQLNVPLSGLDTSHGVKSEIVQLIDRASGEVRYTARVRELIASGNTLYAGSYSLCHIPNYPGPCVKVVFPLPNGNAIVFLRPEVHADGSFTVTSVGGRRFGDPGLYFTVYRNNVYARYVRPLHESIHVYAGNDGYVRSDHVMFLWGATFLRLHYRLELKEKRSERNTPGRAQATA